MRKASRRSTVDTTPYTPPSPFEKHYSPQELAALWGYKPDFIRDLFRKERGVMAVSHPETMRKRRYTRIKIPESVAQRVHRKLRVQ